MELHKYAPDQTTLPIDDYKGTILRTSLVTLGGLFLILFSIVIAADMNLFRSQRRESILIEERLAERELAHAELEAKNQTLIDESLAKSQILSTVTHELKTPLTSIVGYADRLLLRQANVGQLNERQERYVTAISESSEQLQVLINDLLDISRIEAGRLEITTTDLEAGKKIEEIVQIMQTQFVAKQIGVSINVPAGLRPVYADEDRFSQVMMNLLSNACKYSPAGTEITVSGKEAGDFVQIDVADSGIGMSESAQEKLFSKFFRADNTATRTEPGTGLGLFIARQLMQAQGGEIWAASEEGVGSTFSITFPCAEQARLYENTPGENAVVETTPHAG